MSTANAINPSQIGPTTQTFAPATVAPPTLPPISNTAANLRAALLDQLQGFQISLQQHLFVVAQNPNDRILPFNFIAGTAQQEAVQNDLNNILITVIAINQITNTPANRIPANASNNTNPPYDFINPNQNTVINAINQISRNIFTGTLSAAQLDYATLQGLLNPIYGY